MLPSARRGVRAGARAAVVGEGRTGVANETEPVGGSTGSPGAGDGDGALRLSGYDSPNALANGLTGNWTESVAALSTGAIERHARDNFHDTPLADDIAEVAKDKTVSEDTRLFRVIMRLDPREHPEFMGYELSEQGLADLSSEVNGPFPTWSATAALRILYTDRVLSIAADATKTSRFRELDDRWHEEFEAWGKLASRSHESGGPDIYSKSAWQTRAKILHGLIDTKGDEALRQRAREAMQKPTVAEWTSDVGSLDGAGVGTIMGVADLGDAADTYDQSRQDEKKENSSKRRRGAVSGFVSIGLIVLIVFAVAAFTSTSGTGPLDLGNSATPSVAPSKSIDPVNATVIGTATIIKDSPLLQDPKAGATVVQQLKKGDRVYQIAHDENGFYEVRLSTDDKVFGWVNKDDATIICPVKCG